MFRVIFQHTASTLLKWKLVITFGFHSCSTNHGNCTATRLCAIISSSHSFGALWNVVMLPKCSGNSLTLRKKARFDTGAQACCGTTLEVPSASFKAQQITGLSIRKHELLSACLRVRPRASVHVWGTNVYYHQPGFVWTQSTASIHVRFAESKHGK